jgi:FtsZ-binding cell division protein ZapB
VSKKILAVATVTIVALLVAALFAVNQICQLQNQVSELDGQNSDLQNQMNDLQEQNSDLQDENDGLQQQLDLQQKWLDYQPQVRITEFSGGGWWNPVGVTLALDFTIKIYNSGISDVEGLTLEIKRYGFDEDPFAFTKKLDILAGNTTEIHHSIYMGLSDYDEYQNNAFVATLKLGDAVLDVGYYQPPSGWA